MKDWMAGYIGAHKAVLDAIPLDSVAQIVKTLQRAAEEDRQIFVFGNGGSAANASHFSCDLGKGASDKWGKRFRVISLNENTSWMTALANDYAYEDVFAGQLMSLAQPGDVVLTMSVSGDSPNLVKAVEWANQHGLHTIALVGAKRGRLAELADQVIVIDSLHYGRVEDAHLGICHLIAYAFMELPPEAITSTFAG